MYLSSSNQGYKFIKGIIYLLKSQRKMIMYGIMTKEGQHIDISTHQRGAKIFATKNGYKAITRRIGYVAYVCSENISGKWVDILQN